MGLWTKDANFRLLDLAFLSLFFWEEHLLLINILPGYVVESAPTVEHMTPVTFS